MLWAPTNPGEALAAQQMQAPALALGLMLGALTVREFEEFAGAFTVMTRERADALLVVEGQLAQTRRRHIVGLAATHQMPAIYGFRGDVDAGGLMAYAGHRGDLFHCASIYVDKVLKGAQPAHLPVEQY